MIRHRWLLATALVAGFALTAQAADEKPVTLTWQLTKPFVQEVTSHTTTVVKAKGKENKQGFQSGPGPRLGARSRETRRV